MTTSALQLVALVLSAGVSATWFVAVRPRPDTGRMIMPGIALTLTLLLMADVAMLWTRGWWFIGEKVVFGLPATMTAAVVAVCFMWRDFRLSRPPAARTRTAKFAAGSAAAATVLMQIVVGYPAPLFVALIMLALVAVTTVISWVKITGNPWRRPAIAAVGIMILVLGTAVVSRAATPADAQRDAHAGHDGHAGHAGHGGAVEGSTVDDLRTPSSVPGERVRITLEAQNQQISLPSGRTIEAWTYGSLPGPTIVAHQGDVIEVDLRNRDIEAGVTVHWHGYDVPNGEDGVAGVTQDAVPPGGSHSYRFVAHQAGTYWYHTHQRSAEGVPRGLYGTLVVLPADGSRADVDLVLPFHTQSGTALLGSEDIIARQVAREGQSVRLRLINTDQVSRQFVLTGTSFRVAAIDGSDLAGASPIHDQILRLPAGGRYDITFTMPSTAVRLGVAGFRSVGLLMAGRPDSPDPGQTIPDQVFDPLAYGTPEDQEPLPTTFDRRRTVVLDRLPRWHEGRPRFAYTMDGAVYPHIPATRVDQGDVVLFRVVNRSFETHPMHPHGHHVRVISVNGRTPQGSPLWLDTFEVRPGEVWEVALWADNPGIWMDHCHNLDHAAKGMMTHLTYSGITTPYVHGGPAENAPE